jgi:hypothetical protein
MRKITFLFLFLGALAFSNAQNLVTNGNFEADAGTYTVVESSANVLKRVASIYDATIQGTNPTATAGEDVVAGQWVKHSPDDANVKATVNATAGVDAGAGLSFKIQAGSTTTVYDKSLSAIVLQKLAAPLNNTKRYKVKFKAKLDVALHATLNNCGGVNILLGDNVIKSTTNPLMVGVVLTGGTAWTSYEAILDVPQYVAANPTADFSNAYLGFCISTKIASNKTNNSSFIIDDIELEEFNNYAVKYVKSTASGSGDGSSWANASADLQAMIDAVEYGAVHVAAGLYKPSATINVKDGVHLMGGYAADGSGVRNVLQNKTILDGDGNKRIIQNSNTTNPFRYLTKVDGFVLQNGNSDNGSAASLSLGVMLENCIIRNNTGGAKGAAVYFSRNTLLSGQGYNKFFQQTGVIFNSLIINNSSTGGSAAIYGEASSLYSVVNCVIANNKCTEATTGTGGIFIGGSGQWTQLQNNIFYNNSGATDALNNITNRTATNPVALSAIINNWFDNATMPVSFSTAASNLSANNKTNSDIASPGFVLATLFQGAATTNEQFEAIEASDWRLQSTSELRAIGSITQAIKFPFENFHAILTTTPALDFVNIEKDLAGNPRISGGVVDLGAFQYVPDVSTSDNKTVNNDKTQFVKVIKNEITVIENVNIEVYGVAGNLVARAKSGATINIPQSGIYVVKIFDGVNVSAQKIIIK